MECGTGTIRLFGKFPRLILAGRFCAPSGLPCELHQNQPKKFLKYQGRQRYQNTAQAKLNKLIFMVLWQVNRTLFFSRLNKPRELSEQPAITSTFRVIGYSVLPYPVAIGCVSLCAPFTHTFSSKSLLKFLLWLPRIYSVDS